MPRNKKRKFVETKMDSNEPKTKKRKCNDILYDKHDILCEKYGIIFPETFYMFNDFIRLNNIDLKAINLQLVGPFEYINDELNDLSDDELHIHWRYYYDLPEFRTIIKVDNDDTGLHWGYWIDEPNTKPVGIVLSTNKVHSEVTGCADNLFTFLYNWITNKSNKFNNNIISHIQTNLIKYTKSKHIKILKNNKEIKDYFKKRSKNIVAKCFHKFGIIVPMNGDIGYRPINTSIPQLKSIFQKMYDDKMNGKPINGKRVNDIITCVCLADDEGDPGMGYELGINFFCSYNIFNKKAKKLLSNAYHLLNRHKFIEILNAHLNIREQRHNNYNILSSKIKNKQKVHKKSKKRGLDDLSSDDEKM